MEIVQMPADNFWPVIIALYKKIIEDSSFYKPITLSNKAQLKQWLSLWVKQKFVEFTTEKLGGGGFLSSENVASPSL